MKAPLSNRPVWQRVSVAFLLGLLLMVLINIFGIGSASAAPVRSSDFAGVSAEGKHETRWYRTCYGSMHKNMCRGFMDSVTSPDARQAIGGAVGGCAVGAVVSGGVLGCLGGAAGSLAGSLPYDGSWD